MIVLVLASGRGKRMGLEMPKQYAKIAGSPLISWTLDSLAASQFVTQILPVIHPEDTVYYNQLKALPAKCLPPVFGADERFQSTLKGLQSIAIDNPDYVMIHDGVRPFVSQDLIKRLVTSATKGGSAPALSIQETLRRKTDEEAFIDVDRTQLYRIQTPQVFPFKSLWDAFERFMNEKPFPPTDDAGIYGWAGYPLTYVEGCPINIKVTTPADMAFCERVLK